MIRTVNYAITMNNAHTYRVWTPLRPLRTELTIIAQTNKRQNSINYYESAPMIVIVTNSRGIEMRWETGGHKAIDALIAALKLNVPDWQKINNDKDQA